MSAGAQIASFSLQNQKANEEESSDDECKDQDDNCESGEWTFLTFGRRFCTALSLYGFPPWLFPGCFWLCPGRFSPLLPPDIKEFRGFEVFIFDFLLLPVVSNMQAAFAAFPLRGYISTAPGAFHCISPLSGKGLV